MPPPRRKGPALYELLGSRPVNKPGTLRAPVEDPHEPEEDSAFGIKPGRSIRVPMGYLFFALAGVIALIIGGYMLGYHQRDRVAEQDKLRLLTGGNPDSGDAADGGGISDPLTGNRSGSSSDRAGSGSGGNSQAQRPPAGGSRTGSPLNNVWFVRDGVADPRERGRNYFMLASNYPWDEAEKAALFLGNNGIGTVVYPSGRADRWNLSTRQGFERGSIGGEEYQALETRIKDLGQRYEATERGATDFSDLWPRRLD